MPSTVRVTMAHAFLLVLAPESSSALGTTGGDSPVVR